MGQPTRPTDLGSRRVMVLTVVASVLLIVAGLLILHSAGSLRLGRPTPHPSSVTTTPAPATSTSTSAS